MVRSDVVLARLRRLDEYLGILRGLQRHDLAAFLSDPVLRGAAERYLHLSIECVLDIGNRVIGDRGWPKPSSYAEVFEILDQQGAFPPGLAARVAGMAPFRNLLVHDYLRIDSKQVHEILATRLEDLAELGRVYGGMVAG